MEYPPDQICLIELMSGVWFGHWLLSCLTPRYIDVYFICIYLFPFFIYLWICRWRDRVWPAGVVVVVVVVVIVVVIVIVVVVVVVVVIVVVSSSSCRSS